MCKMNLKYFLLILFSARCIFSLPASGLNTDAAKRWDSMFGSNVTSLVQLLHNGKKSYYFGYHFKATYFQAAQFCEDIHMNLISIESAEENDRIYKYVRDSNKGDLFWTAGSKLMDGKHWIWMSEGQPVGYTNWAPGNPDSQTEHCIAAFHSKNVGLTWTDRDCLVQMGFICERRMQDNDTLEENTSMTQWNSVYENPFVSPNIPLFHVKDKSYFLGRYFKATFQEAIQMCKMIKMDLVSITSKEENDRIYKYIRDTNAGDAFWTSGSRMIDGTTWVWMSTAKLVDYTNWYTGQPDSVTDHCIQLLAQKDKGLFWVDSGCGLRYFYICEKPRETFYFDRIDSPITQFEASEFCQRRNMQLISIRTPEENEEVRQLLLHHSSISGNYWTSARRANGKDNWTWSSGLPVSYSNFDIQVNEQLRKNAYCLGITPNATWSMQFCNEKCFFICEESDALKKCPKVPYILNIHVNSSAKNSNMSFHPSKPASRGTLDAVTNMPDIF